MSTWVFMLMQENVQVPSLAWHTSSLQPALPTPPPPPAAKHSSLHPNKLFISLYLSLLLLNFQRLQSHFMHAHLPTYVLCLSASSFLLILLSNWMVSFPVTLYNLFINFVISQVVYSLFGGGGEHLSIMLPPTAFDLWASVPSFVIKDWLCKYQSIKVVAEDEMRDVFGMC